MAQGTVKWFHADKGSGFIAPDDGTPDVFVHQSVIETEGYRSLADNQRVEYTATRGAKGPQAARVPPLSPAGRDSQHRHDGRPGTDSLFPGGRRARAVGGSSTCWITGSPAGR